MHRNSYFVSKKIIVRITTQDEKIIEYYGGNDVFFIVFDQRLGSNG